MKMGERILLGKFCLNGESSNSMFGYLCISKNRILLEIHEVDGTFSLKNITYILGQCGGFYVYLDRLYSLRISHSSSGYSSATMKFFKAIVIDKPFSSANELQITTGTLQIHGLGTFMPKSNILRNPLDIECKPFLSSDLHKFPQIKYEYNVGNDVRVNFLTAYSSTERLSIAMDSRELPVKEHVLARLIHKEGFSLESFEAYVFDLCDFISFAVRGHAYTTEVEISGILHSNHVMESVKFMGHVYEVSNRKGASPVTRDYFNSLLFLNDCMKRDFALYFSRWRKLRKTNETFLWSLLGKYKNRNIYWENEYLLYFTGLEKFTANECKDEILLTKNVEKRTLEAAQKAIKRLKKGTNIRDALEKFTNRFPKEVTLKQMITTLRKKLPDFLRDEITESDINLALDMRHAIVHGGISEKLIIETENRQILRKLHRIAEFCAMTWMGIAVDNQIKNALLSAKVE